MSDFRYAEGKSKFSEHVLNEGHEMLTIEETMSIIDFRYAEGKSKFSEHVLNDGHEMKTIEETMSIIHLENKTSDMQKANPNSLNMSLTKDMK